MFSQDILELHNTKFYNDVDNPLAIHSRVIYEGRQRVVEDMNPQPESPLTPEFPSNKSHF